MKPLGAVGQSPCLKHEAVFSKQTVLDSALKQERHLILPKIQGYTVTQVEHKRLCWTNLKLEIIDTTDTDVVFNLGLLVSGFVCAATGKQLLHPLMLWLR